jgi:hypothetical protein
MGVVQMTATRPDARPTRLAGTVERAVRSLIENPARFSYGALAFSAFITSLRGFDSAGDSRCSWWRWPHSPSGCICGSDGGLRSRPAGDR